MICANANTNFDNEKFYLEMELFPGSCAKTVRFAVYSGSGIGKVSRFIGSIFSE